MVLVVNRDLPSSRLRAWRGFKGAIEVKLIKWTAFKATMMIAWAGYQDRPKGDSSDSPLN